MDKRKVLRKVDRSVGVYACLAGYLAGRGLEAVSTGSRSPRGGKERELGKVLLMKLVGRGDTVLMLPTVKALRERLPHARLYALLSPLSTGTFAAGGVDVDEVIEYDVLGKDAGVAGFVRLVRRLRRTRFDLVIDYEQHIKLVTLLSYLTGASERVGFVWRDGKRGLLLTRRVLFNDRVHMAEAFADLVRSVGVPCDADRLVGVHVPVEDRAFVTQWLRRRAVGPGEMVVAMHPGSGGSALGRRWPADRFARLADRITQTYGARVLLTGTIDELGLIEGIARTMAEEAVVAAGEFNFRQVAALLERCSLTISNDTGIVHLAAAMGTPVVALFGPNLPVRYGPIGEGHAVLYKKEECSPCINIHLGETRTCETPMCMHSISLDEVWEAVRARLDAASRARDLEPVRLCRTNAEVSLGSKGGRKREA